MAVNLLPSGYPENTDPANIKAWADYHNHTLIGAYLRKHADLFVKIAKDVPPGTVVMMPMMDVAHMMDELAWEIEGQYLHQRAGAWNSERLTHDLLTKCFLHYKNDR